MADQSLEVTTNDETAFKVEVWKVNSSRIKTIPWDTYTFAPVASGNYLVFFLKTGRVLDKITGATAADLPISFFGSPAGYSKAYAVNLGTMQRHIEAKALVKVTPLTQSIEIDVPDTFNKNAPSGDFFFLVGDGTTNTNSSGFVFGEPFDLTVNDPKYTHLVMLDYDAFDWNRLEVLNDPENKLNFVDIGSNYRGERATSGRQSSMSELPYSDPNHVIKIRIKPPSVDVITPANKIFVLDSEALEIVSKVPLYERYTGGTTLEGVYDLQSFIINLIALPFQINPDDLGVEQEIIIGGYSAVAVVPTLETDLYRFNLGSIIVPPADSSIDYLEAEYNIILPCCDVVVSLEASAVLGKTITAEFLVDLYSGDTNLNIYNGSPEPLNTTKVKLGRLVPIRFAEASEKLGTNIFGAFNGIYSMMLEKITPELVEGKYSNMVELYSKLGDLSGYVEVSNIQLDLPAGGEEIEEVRQILARGVFINE